MTIQIRPNLLWCRANDRAVFLNLTNQRYFMLHSLQANAFEKWCGGECLTPKDLNALSSVLTDNPSPICDWHHGLRPSLDFPRPSRCTYDIEELSPYPSLVLKAFACHAIARIGLHAVSFADLMHRLYDRKQARHVVSTPCELTRAAATFAMTTRLLRSSDRCLQTSLALALFLAKLGHYPEFVVGVKTAPWAAHAWVQTPDLVLNDEAQRVLAFAPILVI